MKLGPTCVIKVNENGIPRGVLLDDQEIPSIVTAQVVCAPDSPMRLEMSVFISDVSVLTVVTGLRHAESPAPLPPPAIGFMECDTCRTKSGAPTLCAGCLHNRAMIEALAADARRYRWLCDGNGYFMEEAHLCASTNDKQRADLQIDEAMRATAPRSK